MPGVARGRGDEDAARPAAAAQRGFVDAARSSRRPCRGGRRRPARRRRGRSGWSRGRAPSPARRDRARAGNATRSSSSAGSNSHSALPPLLNQTSGASGASAVSLPRTCGHGRDRAHLLRPRLADAVGKRRRPFGDVAGAHADDHVALGGEVAQRRGTDRRGRRPRAPCGGRGRAGPRPAPRSRRPRSAPRRRDRPASTNTTSASLKAFWKSSISAAGACSGAAA